MAHISKNSDANSTSDRFVNARVIDAGGHEASIVSMEHEDDNSQVWVRLDDGTQVLVPVSLMTQQADGMYRLPFNFDFSSDNRSALRMAFPVMEEQLHVDKRLIETGRGIRVHKTVAAREQVLDEPLMREEIVVEHVPVDRMLDDAQTPQARYEGDTLIVPILEEVLVVQKKLLLKEEIHITRKQHEVREPQTVSLRYEQVRVERFDEGTAH